MYQRRDMQSNELQTVFLLISMFNHVMLHGPTELFADDANNPKKKECSAQLVNRAESMNAGQFSF